MRDRKGYKPVLYSTHDEDKKQIELAIGGSQRAFSYLFRRFKPIMYKVCKRRFKHMSVEDIEDEVLLFFGQIFTKLDKYDPEKATFATWITYCWHNHLNSIKKRKKRIITDGFDDFFSDEDDTRTLEPIEESLDTTRIVNINMSYVSIYRMMLKALPKKEAKFAVAFFYHGYNTKESEDYAGLSRGSGAYYKRQIIKKINETYRRETFL